MEFINQDNGKIAAEKLLHQIGTPFQQRICSFEFDNRESAVELLIWHYRREIGQQEQDASKLRDYAEKVIDWATNVEKPCLMLFGGVGCGKTTMLNAFCKMITTLYYSNISYERRGFQWESAETIANWARYDKPRFEDFKRCEWAAIDDLGIEPNEISDYGTMTYPIRDILMHRYEQNLLTIISTNLPPRSLTEKYGTRVGDRLAEIAKVITFDDNSFRR